MQQETAIVLSLPVLEPVTRDIASAASWGIYERNQAKRAIVEQAFRQIMEWAGENIGYGTDQDERNVTGLAQLLYLNTIEPQWAVRFAVEICEENNYHSEAARLDRMLTAMQSPYRNQPHQSQSVNWWAE